MAAIIPDHKKEEIRATADLVEVAEDYVKLKRSGRSWKGLCPFHDEKTPSFHVTPELGIYKCFGCGESGDVFDFLMAMEGIGFVEAMRSLADRFGISLPEPDEQQDDEEHNLREGIYHALKYAGVYYHTQLKESDEAEKARQYLSSRGYNMKLANKYGLGYAPAKGEALFEAAIDSGLNEEYLQEAGLIKPSNRGEGFYDAFRGRLMFPIFNPSGKVIAFAGRVLGGKKTAKYINSPQTKVYNKSKVLYGVNFAKNDIRKRNEVLLVEGYTDVISLQQHGIMNVVASSGTSLTPDQLKLLHRYGDTITMLYDGDAAGQKAMKRGINLALAEGMDVELLDLPEDHDPDSFIRQFGADSFSEVKNETAEDFVSYLVHKAQNKGDWDKPAGKKKVISEALESIAHMDDRVGRETFVQHLNKLAKVGDRALFEELENIRQELQQQKERARRRKERRAERSQRQQQQTQAPMTGSVRQPREPSPPAQTEQQPQKRPGYEKELIRLMLQYNRKMVSYVGSHCSEKHFSDDQLREFYTDIIERFKADDEISPAHYQSRDEPFARLMSDIMVPQFNVNERDNESINIAAVPDEKPYRVAKGALKSLQHNYLLRMLDELTDNLMSDDEDTRKEAQRQKIDLQRRKTRFERTNANELFPDPPSSANKNTPRKTFHYEMKKSD